MTSPCVSQSLRRYAGSGVVSPISAARCQTGSCAPLVSLCLRRWLRGRVSRLSRCCDAGSGVVSPACRLSPSVCGRMPDAVTLAPGSRLLLVSLYLPSVSQSPAPGSCPDAVTLAPGLVSLCLKSLQWCLPVSAVRGQCLPSLCLPSPACVPVSPSLCQMR